jgi:hypothetical protein
MKHQRNSLPWGQPCRQKLIYIQGFNPSTKFPYHQQPVRLNIMQPNHFKTITIITSAIFLMLTGCTTMGDIKASQPMGMWQAEGRYDEVGFCIVDDFERELSTGFMLNVRNRTHEDVLEIQGIAVSHGLRADGRISYFEVRCGRSVGNSLVIELRGIESDDTSRMIKAIESCAGLKGATPAS